MRPVRIALLTALVSSLAAAEILPETGTFDGIYHRDRWDNASLRFLRFDGEIAQRLDRYEGERIRVKVTKGEQTMSPGPVYVREIDSVEVLPECPVGMVLSLVPENPVEHEPCQIVIALTNRGDEVVVLGDSASDQVGLSLVGERATPVPTSRDGTGAEHPPGAEPTGHASAWGTLPGRSGVGLQHTGWHMLDATSRARLGHGHLRLEPGASFPLVVTLAQGLPAGAYELTSRMQQRVGEESVPSFAALAFDVEPATVARLPVYVRAPEIDVRRVDPWTHEVSMLVRAPEGTQLAADPSWYVAFLARGLSEEGDSVPVTHANPVGEPSALQPVPEDGRRVNLRVRHATRFPDIALDRVRVYLLTRHGLVLVYDEVPIEDDVVRVPFGPERGGVRMRGIPDVPVQRAGQSRLFFRFQAENVGDAPVQWRFPIGCDGEGVTITIDGEPIELRDRPARYVGGWALHRLCDEPAEWSVVFDRPEGLAPGRHVLRLTIHGKGGTKRNTSGTHVPLLDGDLVSNDVAFVLD